jgi:hypothetical protein
MQARPIQNKLRIDKRSYRYQLVDFGSSLGIQQKKLPTIFIRQPGYLQSPNFGNADPVALRPCLAEGREKSRPL